MKLFVTGATGFIGSHFLNHALAAGHEVIALRRRTSRPRILLTTEPHWSYSALDQVSSEDLRGCQTIVHLASPGVSPQIASWADLFYWNVTATVRLVEQARLAGIKRLVVAGTFAEYGRSADRFDKIPPNAPLEPTNGYAASKAAAATALAAYAIEHKLELAYLRIFSAFGDGQHESNLWPSLRDAAQKGEDFPMTKGEQVRDYVPVVDVASVLCRAATSLSIESGYPLVANVGSGSPVTIRDFAKTWWSRFGARGNLLLGALPYRANEVMRFVPLVHQI